MKIQVLTALMLINCMTNFAHAKTVIKVIKPARVVAQSTVMDIKTVRVRPQNNNNIKLFPLRAALGAVHMGYDRALSKNWVIGLEFSFMPQARDSMSVVESRGNRVDPRGFNIEDNYTEQFGGLLGQYYFNRAFEGLFVEAGIDYVLVTGYYTAPYFMNPLRIENEVQGDYAYPFLGAGYRLSTSFGMNFGLGVGGGMYIGETLYLQDLPYQQRIESEYYSGKMEARARMDVSYSF
jgi:hypothetical protein